MGRRKNDYYVVLAYAEPNDPNAMTYEEAMQKVAEWFWEYLSNKGIGFTGNKTIDLKLANIYWRGIMLGEDVSTDFQELINELEKNDALRDEG